jgi:galactose mutarotase-like enzyme
MIEVLSNKNLTLKVNSKGAEINELKDLRSGKDVIWNGDPSIWKFHAPVLFPHCGKIKDAFVLIDGKEYPLKSNGFARDQEFILVEKTSSSVKFELTENSTTLSLFPYKFRLSVKYELLENAVAFTTTVKNTGDEPFLFSLGSHSAFSIDNPSDYEVEFEKKTPLTNVICLENGFLAEKNGKCPVTKLYGEAKPGVIPVTERGFGNGHLFTQIDSDWVGLRNKKNGSIVRVNTKDYPYVMIWQNAGKPEFVCIEPWYGMPDAEQKPPEVEPTARDPEDNEPQRSVDRASIPGTLT